MREALVAVLIFLCLLAAALGSLVIHIRLPLHHRQDDTHSVVRSVANIFVVMTSLVLGLMINSAKNTFEAVDHNVHVFATDLIMLDRMMLQYGPDADDARGRLLTYVERAVHGKQPDDPLKSDRTSEHVLDEVGKSLIALKPDAEHAPLRQSALQQFQKVVELRWTLVEQSEGAIPTALLVMVIAWLVLIFASLGYRAPRNAVVLTSFVVSSFLIASTIYLIIDLGIPFEGPIQVSLAPLERAIVEIKR